MLFHLLVPGGKVAYRELQRQLLGQFLQRDFPPAPAAGVGAAASGGDPQAGRLRRRPREAQGATSAAASPPANAAVS
jgi:hypothetical protein